MANWFTGPDGKEYQPHRQKYKNCDLSRFQLDKSSIIRNWGKASKLIKINNFYFSLSNKFIRQSKFYDNEIEIQVSQRMKFHTYNKKPKYNDPIKEKNFKIIDKRNKKCRIVKTYIGIALQEEFKVAEEVYLINRDEQIYKESIFKIVKDNLNKIKEDYNIQISKHLTEEEQIQIAIKYLRPHRSSKIQKTSDPPISSSWDDIQKNKGYILNLDSNKMSNEEIDKLLKEAE